MVDPNKNVRKGGMIGMFVGVIIASLANGYLILTADPDGGQVLAQIYVGLFTLISNASNFGFIFKRNIVKNTTLRGFIMGLGTTVSTMSIGTLVFLGQITTLIQSILGIQSTA